MACLELTSLSSLSLERAGGSFDLVFDLSSRPLPAFSAIDCWRGRCISPLRDRVMIEWLCSHYEAETLLDSMTSSINKALKKLTSNTTSSETPLSKEETGRVSLQVGVACQNGAQHSVCFVERLYEKYSSESALELVGGVSMTVERKHCEATKGEWLHTKEPVWQHSRFSVKNLPQLPRDLVVPRVWSNLPLTSTQQVEAAFLQDPLKTDLDIGKHIINFEKGVLLNKESQQEFKIRSTIASFDGKVRSCWLDDVEYRALHKSYNSAGILFYSIHPRTGEPVFLLGHMTYSCMSWCDFGGLKGFRERAKFTAARECYEETLGILGSNKALVSMLNDYVDNNVFKIVNKDSMYVGHYLRVPYKDYPSMFALALATATGKIEVDQMRWFSLSSLKSAVHKALLDQYEFRAHPLNKDGSIDDSCRPVRLRMEFVHSLCIADQLGVLKSIEHIARTLHERNKPPPPPYVSIPQPRLQHKEEQRSERQDSSDDEGTRPEVISDTDQSLQNIEEEFVLVSCEELATMSKKTYSNFCMNDGGCSPGQAQESNQQGDSHYTGTSSSESHVEGDGLRRRKAKATESSLSRNGLFTTKNISQVKETGELDAATSSTFYGIGAGDFLY